MSFERSSPSVGRPCQYRAQIRRAVNLPSTCARAPLARAPPFTFWSRHDTDPDDQAISHIPVPCNHTDVYVLIVRFIDSISRFEKKAPASRAPAPHTKYMGGRSQRGRGCGGPPCPPTYFVWVSAMAPSSYYRKTSTLSHTSTSCDTSS